MLCVEGFGLGTGKKIRRAAIASGRHIGLRRVANINVEMETKHAEIEHTSL